MDLAGLGMGQFLVTVSMQVYFQSLAVRNVLANEGSFTLAFTIGQATGQKYTFNLPNLKAPPVDPAAEGANQDFMETIEATGVYDLSGSPAFGATMSVTRAVA